MDPDTFTDIGGLMNYLGQPGPTHPLVTVVRFGAIARRPSNLGKPIRAGFYVLGAIGSLATAYRQSTDVYDDARIIGISPGQALPESFTVADSKSILLCFHPDLLNGYPLHGRILKYRFFNQETAQECAVSHRENTIVRDLLEAIERESEYPCDAYSHDILRSQIEQLLIYTNRFYGRSHNLEKHAKHDLMRQLDAVLSSHFSGVKTIVNGLVTVAAVAEHLHVTQHYLSSTLRSLAGQNTQQYIHNKLLENTRELLVTSNLNIAEIAYRLGFEHPQSLSKLFKRKLGSTPTAFRRLHKIA